jgi:hypothetical protein
MKKIILGASGLVAGFKVILGKANTYTKVPKNIMFLRGTFEEWRKSILVPIFKKK